MPVWTAHGWCGACSVDAFVESPFVSLEIVPEMVLDSPSPRLGSGLVMARLDLDWASSSATAPPAVR
jgi:hypothetical protein